MSSCPFGSQNMKNKVFRFELFYLHLTLCYVSWMCKSMINFKISSYVSFCCKCVCFKTKQVLASLNVKKIRNNRKFIVFVADVVRAREELDGLRQPSRPFNPLTIIQVRVCEKKWVANSHRKKGLHFQTSSIYDNPLVNVYSFYANFTNSTFQRILIPHVLWERNSFTSANALPFLLTSST